jgi:hypothetical protein
VIQFRFAAASIVLASSASAGVLGDTLIVNGKRANVDTRVIAGSVYVKLSDVARALDMVVTKRGSGQYELVRPGGANQIGTLAGGIGDTLFDGKWRFTVVSVETADTYTMKSDSEPYGAHGQYEWNRTTHLLRPSRGYELVVIQCRVKNGVAEKRTLWTAISDERIRTSLTDLDANSYAPIGYDFAGAPIQTEWILPGAQIGFPVLFSVPQGAKLKDLVFTLKNNQGDQKGVDVRVSLSKQ